MYNNTFHINISVCMILGALNYRQMYECVGLILLELLLLKKKTKTKTKQKQTNKNLFLTD